MKEKKIDIINKYTREVQDIENKLKDLEKGRIYELSNAKMDGYLATNIIQLRNMIRELIFKIEYGEDSINDQLSQLFNINKNSQSLGRED
jgi:uncharacterized protein YeeX (DUF496 family)